MDDSISDDVSSYGLIRCLYLAKWFSLYPTFCMAARFTGRLVECGCRLRRSLSAVFGCCSQIGDNERMWGARLRAELRDEQCREIEVPVG